MKTGQPNRCQCSGTCPFKSGRGKAFCRFHEHHMCSQSPLSGFEPAYRPALWNSKTELRETHNCFSYAMNVNDPKQIARCHGKVNCNAPFHQPGAAAGFRGFDDQAPKTCPNMLARIMGDNPNIHFSTFPARCPKGSSKIALIVDESDDYHFLRQDSNGYWSHKPGARPVTNIDASQHTITNPELADFDYTKAGSTLKYDIFCGYMCVPRNRPLFLRVSGGGGGRTRKLPRAASHAS
jgi:hypothetical protein